MSENKNALQLQGAKESGNLSTSLSHKDSNVYNKKSFPVFTKEMFTGENIQSSAIQTLVNSCLINTHERLDPPPVAMQIVSGGLPITLFTKGNFSIITGAAKSRKSFLISMFIACALKGNLQDLLISSSNGITIIFDTEQAKYKVQQIAKRILSLSDNLNPDNLHVYSLRTLEPSQRIDLIDHILSTTHNINFVAIDGIIDLEIDPILQAEQAQRIVMKLMQWSEIYNIHITCVLHYNKTVSTLLGHLGSFSHRKADAIIEVSKSKDDESISIVRPVDCREKEFIPFAFSIDGYAMPYILQDYVIDSKIGKESKTKKPAVVFSQLENNVHNEILNSVFLVDKEQGYTDCWRNIKNALATNIGVAIGDNKAKDFLADYIFSKVIVRKEQSKKKPVYALP